MLFWHISNFDSKPLRVAAIFWLSFCAYQEMKCSKQNLKKFNFGLGLTVKTFHTATWYALTVSLYYKLKLVQPEVQHEQGHMFREKGKRFMP